jgi:adenine-specific DNA-methyltransferase
MFVTEETVRVPQMKWNERKKEYELLEQPSDAETILWPVDGNGDERCWRWGLETTREKLSELVVKTNPKKQLQIYNKYRPNTAGVLPLTIWTDKKYSSTEYGTGLVKNLFGGRSPFDFPKSLYATKDCIHICSIGKDGIVLDCFGGSGTTAHAAICLNREDAGTRRFIVLEMGDHFDSVLIPRIKKVVYAPDWRAGRPLRRDDGTSYCFKYIRLESYDDSLNNIALSRSDQQATLLDQDDDLREQYVLSYMLDVESRGSQSLLNVESFRNPDQYKLRVERNGETQLVNVDLVETFNWLLGLTTKHIDVIRGVRVVEGTNPNGDRTLVLWRNLDETNNDALDEWFKKQDYNTKDQEYDLIYVNGDNNLENLRRGDQTWKVRLIEEEFGRLMFDVEDI